MQALRRALEETAAQLGYAKLGVARAERLEPEAARLDAWLAAGRHGEMDYMQRTAAVRADPRHPDMLKSARSIVVLAMPYARTDALYAGAPGRIARYAQGRDYHTLLYDRGRKLGRLLRRAGFIARVAVDSMPVFERAWAQRAGVGFVGKNCCLIVPGVGSHVFLSAIVTSAELPIDEPMRERCGECTLCLAACPTRAFVAERELDARRCISYQTIENRGRIPDELRPAVGEWLFGCDACQDVCPFNRTKPAAAESTTPFAPDARGQGEPVERWLELDAQQFEARTRATALKRATREGLARNAAIVLGNAGSARHLPVLQRAAREHDSELVRETASWASERIVERER